MMQKLREIRKDELVNGSIILFIMIVLFNFLNYGFHISMAKLMGPANFGILAALMSIAYILNIPGEAIQTIVSRYTSRLNAKNEPGKIKDFFYKSMKKGLLFSLIAFMLLIPISFFASKTLKIEVGLILLTSLLIVEIFLVPIGRGVLQGRKKFFSMGLSLVGEAFVKVLFAILFVYIGWGVYGAMGGVWAGGIIAFLFVILVLKDLIKSPREIAKFTNIYKTNVPVLIAITSIVLMYSLDILFARSFFAPEIAGKYAFVSMIGKVIIFVSFSIGKAMLPISSEDFDRGMETRKLFKKSLILVSGISGAILLMYALLPKTIIFLVSLGSTQYLEGANLLFLLGLSYTLLAISNIIVLYQVSINKVSRSFYLLFFVVLQIVVWMMYHSTLLEFVYGFLFVNLIMFLYSLFLIRR
ncbi:MAG: oligosaccharide flippase family protein [Nanoarchaeota archaeon]|nr:oligosaccharide flippase family protein [Nanoarchaeota archaeon]